MTYQRPSLTPCDSMPPIILCGLCRQAGRAETATHYHTGVGGRTNVCTPCADHITALARRFPRTFPTLPQRLPTPAPAKPLSFV